MALLAILASLAAPGMRDLLERRRLIRQAENIVDLVQFARSEAIKHSGGGGGASSISMTVNPGSAWYIGLRNGTAACDGTPTQCAINDGGAMVTRLITSSDCPDCTITSPSATNVITFNFRGLVDSAADSAITLNSATGKQLSIRVSKIGRISLCSPSSSVTGYPAC